MDPAKRKVGRPVTQTAADKPGPPIRITVEADRLLTKQAEKIKIGKGKYASAAISFFAESGLDPTTERAQNLAALSRQVSADTREVRVLSAEIGTRIIAVIRSWERNLYDFLQQQELSRNNHLELVESNILQHQVLVETNLLGPMVESLLKVNLEAYIGRVMGVQVYMKVASGGNITAAEQMENADRERDEQLVKRMREFLRTNTVPVPRPTPKRPVTPVPAKPVTPAAAAPTVPPKR